MPIRSTSSAFYPPPPGKVLAGTGTFRNSNGMARTNFIPPSPAGGTITLAAVRPADTVTVAGQVFTAGTTQVSGAHDFNVGTKATGTIVVATQPSTATLTIGGVALVPAGGARTSGDNDYNETLGTVALIAADILAAINDPANDFAVNVVATTPVAGSVLLTAVTPGEYGNDIDLASSTATITVSGASLTGGVGTDASAAASLAAALADPANGVADDVNVSVTDAVVAVSARLPGTEGNAITLASSNPGRLALSGATLSGATNGRETTSFQGLSGSNTGSPPVANTRKAQFKNTNRVVG